MWRWIGMIQKYLDAEPGDYIIWPEKQKERDNWFMGAITDENARNFTTSLDFLDAGKKYMATIYRDADNADWKNNPEGICDREIYRR